jgi:hypothetical protein
MPLPVFQSSTISAQGAITSLTAPSGVTAGDLILITGTQIDDPGEPGNVSFSGWTQLPNTGFLNGFDVTKTFRTTTWWKISDGTEGSTYTVSGPSGYAQFIAARYSGVHKTRPIDIYTIAKSATDSPHSNPGVTPSVNEGLLVYTSGNYSIASPAWSGATMRNNDLAALADKAAPNSNVATGALTASSAFTAVTSIIMVLAGPRNLSFPLRSGGRPAPFKPGNPR